MVQTNKEILESCLVASERREKDLKLLLLSRKGLREQEDTFCK